MSKPESIQQPLSSWFAKLLVENPWKLLIVGLLIVVGLSAGMSKIKADFTYRVWFNESDPYLKRFDNFERAFGNDENIAIVVHSKSGIFDAESIKLVQGVTHDLWLVPNVIRVDSLTNYNWTDASDDLLQVGPLFPNEMELSGNVLEQKRAKAMAHEILPGYLISKDERTTIIYAQLEPAIGGSPDFKKVTLAAREIVERYSGFGDHELYLTGTTPITYAFEEAGQQDMGAIMPLTMGFIVLLLLLAFRRASGVLLPFVVIICGAVMAFGVSGYIGLSFNNITSAVPPILIAIGVGDSVHILTSYFRNRRFGHVRSKAAELAASTNFTPTLLTSLSTMIGFFSFASSEVKPILEMGVMAGVGALFAWLATMLILIPLLALLPINVKRSAADEKLDVPGVFVLRYVQWLTAWRAPVIFVAIAIIAIGGYAAIGSEVNSDPLRYFAKDVPVRVANEYAEKNVGGMQAIEIVIDSGKSEGIKTPDFLQKVESFQSWLDSQAWVDSTVSLVDILKDTNRALYGGDQSAYRIPESDSIIAQELFLYTMGLPQGVDLNNRMTLDNRSLRLTAMSTLHDSVTVLEKIDEIEAKAKTFGLSAWVTGKMPLTHSINPAVVHSFFYSIGAAFAFITLLMMFVLRSFKSGLLSMVPNIVPLAFAAAAMSLLNRPLDIGVVMVASTCLGIAIDDTMHFLVRFHRNIQRGAAPDIAVAQTIAQCGVALFITTLILVAAFGCFALASFMPNVNFGILTAIVLSSALVLDLTLLPAFLLSPSKKLIGEGRSKTPGLASAAVE